MNFLFCCCCWKICSEIPGLTTSIFFFNGDRPTDGSCRKWRPSLKPHSTLLIDSRGREPWDFDHLSYIDSNLHLSTSELYIDTSLLRWMTEKRVLPRRSVVPGRRSRLTVSYPGYGGKCVRTIRNKKFWRDLRWRKEYRNVRIATGPRYKRQDIIEGFHVKVSDYISFIYLTHCNHFRSDGIRPWLPGNCFFLYQDTQFTTVGKRVKNPIRFSGIGTFIKTIIVSLYIWVEVEEIVMKDALSDWKVPEELIWRSYTPDTFPQVTKPHR